MKTSDPPSDPGNASVEPPSSPTPSPGAPGGAEARHVGPYRLVQVVGEGGMGEVWLAEQTAPIHRTVALKLIKVGMDTKAVVARFESERQALALMDHPCIARVFEAGSTAEGRPYFVMEYVPGLPITEYCDKHKLTIRERLELFTQVCEGVQHAHQKAIIRRDLKPSNLLVIEQDNKAVPKIIDFGLAKATAQPKTIGSPRLRPPRPSGGTVRKYKPASAAIAPDQIQGLTRRLLKSARSSGTMTTLEPVMKAAFEGVVNLRPVVWNA